MKVTISAKSHNNNQWSIKFRYENSLVKTKKKESKQYFVDAWENGGDLFNNYLFKSVCFFKRIGRVNFIGLLCLKDYGNVKTTDFKGFKLLCFKGI